MLTIALPVEKHSEQLDITIEKLGLTKGQYQLDLLVDSTINVAEARQVMIDRCKTQHICFIDYDTETIDSYWLQKMLQTMEIKQAGIVFPNELWGTSQANISMKFDNDHSDQDHPISFGPAACMLIDLNKCKNIKWDKYIGLRNGWLGGDVEEVDYCYRAQQAGSTVYRCMSTAFHHTGGKTTIEGYCGTDRGKTAAIMLTLLGLKYRHAPDDENFFKQLKYIKAQDQNDLMAENGHLRECYRDVIIQNGLDHIPAFKKKGLV